VINLSGRGDKDAPQVREILAKRRNGMSRLADASRSLRARGEKALIPFVTAGDPDLATTEALLPALALAGADAIELGVPFSDPMAEGPTIQRASERALRAARRCARSSSSSSGCGRASRFRSC
jgi:hypothetical protein